MYKNAGSEEIFPISLVHRAEWFLIMDRAIDKVIGRADGFSKYPSIKRECT